MKNVILVHYSSCADLSAMVSEIQQVVGDDVKVTVARRREEIEL